LKAARAALQAGHSAPSYGTSALPWHEMPSAQKNFFITVVAKREMHPKPTNNLKRGFFIGSPEIF